MLAVVLHEELLEVVGAGREDHLVTLDGAAVTGQGHVCEGLAGQKFVKDRQHVGLVVGPPQAEHLGQGIHPRYRQLRQQTEKIYKLGKIFVKLSK